jgi:SAM-dependent methyltransferase
MDRSNWTGERLETWIFSENTNEHLHRYALAREWCSGKEVLDIACGEGYGSHLLAQVAANVTGVDIDAATINLAVRKYKHPRLRFLEGSAVKMPVADASCDVVVSFETLEHHDQHKAMMQEIKRVLKPGGLLIMSSPDKRYYSDVPGYNNPFHVQELYKDEFKALVKTYFSHTQFLSQRSFCGSVMLVDDAGVDDAEPKMYAGDYDAISHGPWGALYNICIAADRPVDGPVSASLFDGDAVLKKQFKELEDYVRGTVREETVAGMKQSIEYRIGALLLKWLPFIRKNR